MDRLSDASRFSAIRRFAALVISPAETMKTWSTGWALLVLAVPLFGCGDGAGETTEPVTNTGEDGMVDGTVFLAQSSPATAVMEALYGGPVTRDEQGCLRLAPDGDAPVAVVWPYGFTLVTQDDGQHVRDAAGRDIGPIGDAFTFGGGYVSSLHDGIPLTQTQRGLAESRCPGTYWIVGDVP